MADSDQDGNRHNDDEHTTNGGGGGGTKAIVVEDFQSPTNTWTTLNDPVMGGQSYSSVTIADGVASFVGKCAIVPSLQAPGFITMETGGKFTDAPASFPDVSSCSAFQFGLRTNTEYAGYRVSFGKAHPKGGRFAYGYKAPLPLDDLPPVGEFGAVVVPFTKFSDKWNDATGEIEVECQDNPEYCPSQQWLKSMETMSFWGEGVEGMIDLEVKSITAIGCDGNASETAVTPSTIWSKIHTIGSNPAYMFSAFALMVLVCAAFCCLYFCCTCCRNCRKKKTMRPIADSPENSTFKDSVPMDDGFHDEEENDLELS